MIHSQAQMERLANNDYKIIIAKHKKEMFVLKQQLDDIKNKLSEKYKQERLDFFRNARNEIKDYFKANVRIYDIAFGSSLASLINSDIIEDIEKWCNDNCSEDVYMFIHDNRIKDDDADCNLDSVVDDDSDDYDINIGDADGTGRQLNLYFKSLSDLTMFKLVWN